MRGNSVNVFKRDGQASEQAAERVRNLGGHTRDEMERLIASDRDVMALVFNQARAAKLIEFDHEAKVWRGADANARLARYERLRP